MSSGQDTQRWELHKLAVQGNRRACLVGSVVIPACFLSDLFLRRAVGVGDSLTHAALRIGVLTAVIFAGYLYARFRGARMGHPFVLGTLYLWTVLVFAAAAAAPTGGPASPYTYGILAASTTWCLLMPGGWRYAAAPVAGSVAIFDAVLLVLSAPPRPFALMAALGVFQLLGVTVSLVCAELLERSRVALATASVTDGLTGLLNRRYLFERLRELSLARRRDQPLGLVMIDIDHFKRINDDHGHLTGDEAIQLVCRLLATEVRVGTDLCGRYGGEEFLLVLPGCAQDAARTVAERIRERVADTPLLVAGKRVTLTISAGVASWPASGEALDPERLVREADDALLQAKRAGRDRVMCAL
jgi:diguanylate cyclase (GGDEF)-like protein